MVVGKAGIVQGKLLARMSEKEKQNTIANPDIVCIDTFQTIEKLSNVHLGQIRRYFLVQYLP